MPVRTNCPILRVPVRTDYRHFGMRPLKGLSIIRGPVAGRSILAPKFPQCEPFPQRRMSTRERSISPSAPSSRPNRPGYHRDRSGRDRRRDRDEDHYERDRRDRDGYRSSTSSRRDRNHDSKRGPRRSASPPSRSSRRPRDSRSKSPSRRRRSLSRSRSKSRRADEDKEEDKDKDEDKGKPNFGSSGLLAAATKTVKTDEGKNVVLKYHEPPEARKPLLGWRLYVFKGKEQVGEWLV